jgi:hypothetical protein
MGRIIGARSDRRRRDELLDRDGGEGVASLPTSLRGVPAAFWILLGIGGAIALWACAQGPGYFAESFAGTLRMMVWGS